MTKTIAVEQNGSIELLLKPQIIEGGSGVKLDIVPVREVQADVLLGNILRMPMIGPALLDPIIKNVILTS